jgi:hypothetical protein
LPPEKRDRVLGAFALLLIVAVGAFIRFDGLAAVGIFGVDDGRYVLDGLAKANEVEFAWSLAEAKRAESRGGPELRLAEAVPPAMNSLADPHPFAPKLGFAYAIAVVLLTGFTVSAGNFVEAFFGTALILVTFGFVRYVSNARAALVAAAFIALSAYCVYFSRNTYPQFISACFVVGAVWAHAVWLKRDASLMWLVFSGALSGVAFWTNYQAAGALPLIALIHAVVSVRRGLRTFFAGGFAMALGFACVLIAAELLSYPMILLFRSQGLVYPQGTFLELLSPRFTGQAAAPFNVTGLALFPYFLGLFHGWVGAFAIAAILIAGAIATVKSESRRTLAVLYFGLAFAVPFALFSLKTMQGARMFTYALPFFAAWFGVAVTAAWSAPQRRMVWRGGVLALIAAALLSNAFALREVRAIRSALPDAVAFAKAQDDPGICAAWSSSIRCYAIEAGIDGDSVYRYLGNDERPPRWFVNDWQELYDRRYPDEPIALTGGGEPVRVLQHAIDRIFLEVEALPSYGNTFDNLRWTRNLDLDRARRVLIYDLEQTALRGEQPRDY